MDWYAHNGGQLEVDSAGVKAAPHKKPLFFDVAFNYVELPMDRLLARASKGGATPAKPTVAPVPAAKAAAAEPAGEGRKDREKRSTKVEEEALPEVKIVQSAPSLGLGGILGGWWGRK